MIKDRQEVHTYVDKNDVMSIHYNKSSFDTLSRKRSLPLNSVYFEVGGSSYNYYGYSFSFDYERVILHIKSFYMDGRIGGFYMSMYQGGNDPVGHVLHLIYLINFQYQFANCFTGELGIGYNSLLGNNNYNKSWDNYNCMIGLRYTGKRGFMMRISYVPFLGEYDYKNNYISSDYKFVIHLAKIPGFAIGYSFGKHKPKKY
jgi:hypothetical protein